MGKLTRVACTLVAVGLCAACTVQQAAQPSQTPSPSGLALTFTITPTPDHIAQDGLSTSKVYVLAYGPNGQPIDQAVRLDMMVSGVLQDYGTLSPRTIQHTGTDSRNPTYVIYTAPPPPPLGSIAPAETRVSITATPMGTNNGDVSSPSAGPASILQSASIILTLPGVILPPAATPVPDFVWSPTTVTVNVPIVFDASKSTSGSTSSAIVSYSWDFGDGSSGSGKTVTHAFRSNDTFTVTLTVTNDRGVPASKSQAIVPAKSALTAAFTVSPDKGVPNQPNTFDASTSTVPAGARIVDYAWNFGDDTRVIHSTTPIVQHTYTIASGGSYTATLTITDNFGNTSVAKVTFQVVGVVQPALAAFTMTPQPATVGQLVTFDSYLSGPGAGGGRIVNERWDFGDGSGVLGVGGPDGGTVQTHTYSKPGTYTITLTVTTDFGNTGSVSHTLLVQ